MPQHVGKLDTSPPNCDNEGGGIKPRGEMPASYMKKKITAKNLLKFESVWYNSDKMTYSYVV